MGLDRDVIRAGVLCWMLGFFLLLVPVVGAEEGSYTVQPGDNLYRIALRHGLTTAELAAANGIDNPRQIYVGQVLRIPEKAVAAEAAGREATMEGADGETTAGEEMAEGAAVTIRTPLLAAPLRGGFARAVTAAESVTRTAAGVAERLSAPPAGYREHVVVAGETLARIARRYGVETAAVARANQLAAPDVIYPGQRLRIPLEGAALPMDSPPPPPAGGLKQIIVDKSDQRAYVYEDGEPLWTFVISTGMAGSETWEGTFRVRSKIPNAYAYNWNLQMPYWLGFYHTGYLENGFHALPIMANGSILWEGYLGTPVSYGCVILSYPDAEKLYTWADIGTEVIVRR